MRCVGHCCRRFAIEHSPEQLRMDYALWKKDPSSSKIKDIEKIATMVIHLKSSVDGIEHVYTCKNLLSNGDCGIYQVRPQMCRDFPESDGCHYRGCKSDRSAYFGMPWWRRWITRWKWLRK